MELFNGVGASTTPRSFTPPIQFSQPFTFQPGKFRTNH